jgi:DNA (cytosine-5)-methyltransferase 1
MLNSIKSNAEIYIFINMKLGSLFSGGGLGDFGFMAAGFDIRWQVEIDEYCQKILALRYPESEKYRDIKTLRGSDLEKVDIITGGFPCQGFSVAGKQKGKEDERYLWPEMLRVIRECRPRWVVGENVPGIINMALDTVCSDMEAEGYEVWPIVFPSHALGAWHKRDRLWIICHANYDGQSSSQESRGVETRSGSGEAEQKQASESSGSGEQYAPMADTRCESERNASNGFSDKSIHCDTKNEQSKERNRPTNSSKNISYSESIGIQGLRTSGKQESNPHGQEGLSLCEGERLWKSYWNAEPAVGRVANGIADRVHRLKMLGNGQVPACTYVIGEFINEVERTINQGG